MEQDTYIPDDFSGSSKPIYSTQVVIKGDQTFERFTPLMRDSTKPETFVKWDGSVGKALYLSAGKFAAPGTDTIAPVYEQFGIRASAVKWPDGLSDAQKISAFAGTPISVSND